QFLGEFLHSYLDTFSHRDKDNRPFDAISVKLGIGHGLAGSEPDYTYDDEYTGNDPIVLEHIWRVRKDRTLAGEKAVYEFLTSYGTRPALGFEEIRSVLEGFNAIREEGKEFSKKTRFLKEIINQLINDKKLILSKNNENEKATKIIEINLEKGGDDEYQTEVAEKNRKIYLDSLSGQEDKYPGVCLPGSSICKKV
ncbi:hypothetical protein PO605_11520, partial [Delftia sp. DT-2]|nr:hypothetical protein [Delftia sp. DT-2]